MPQNTLALIWIVGGAVVMLAELLVPGFVIIFFGVSGIIVGVLTWFGILTNLVYSIVLWLSLSMFFVLIFRKVGVALFPSESSYQLVEEDVDAIGTVVSVIQTVYADNNDGRIEFSGTSWPAISNSDTIEAGKKAKILYRDNISWVVELYEE